MRLIAALVISCCAGCHCLMPPTDCGPEPCAEGESQDESAEQEALSTGRPRFFPVPAHPVFWPRSDTQVVRASAPPSVQSVPPPKATVEEQSVPRPLPTPPESQPVDSAPVDSAPVMDTHATTAAVIKFRQSGQLPTRPRSARTNERVKRTTWRRRESANR